MESQRALAKTLAGWKPDAQSIWPAWAGLLAACGLTLAIESFVANRSPLVSRDALGFIEFAQALLVDPVDAIGRHDQHPGYPILIAGSYQMLDRLGWHEGADLWLAAARLPVLICGVAVVALIWAMAYDGWGLASANWAALTAAVLPLLRQNAADALSDTPHLALYLAAAWLAARALRTGRLGGLAGCGIASGLAYWIRPEGIGAALAVAGLLAAGFSGSAVWQTRLRRIAAAALVLVSAGLVALPHGSVGGRPTSKLVNKPLLVARRAAAEPASPPQPEPRRPSIADTAVEPLPVPKAASDAAAAPVAAPLRTWPAMPPSGQSQLVIPDQTALQQRQQQEQSVLLERSPLDVLGGALVELIGELSKGFRYVLLVPLLWACFAPDRRLAQPSVGRVALALGLLHTALLVVLFYLGGYMSHRHVMPLVALAMPWVGEGLTELVAKLAARIKRPAALPLAGTVAAIVVVGLLLPRSLRPLNPAFAPLRTAAAFLSTLAAPGDAVLTNARHVAFYTQLPSLVLIEDRVPDVAAALSEHPSEFAFIALDIGADVNFHRHWIDQIDARYAFVTQIAGGPYHSPHDVAIFARRDLFERVAQRTVPAVTAAP